MFARATSGDRPNNNRFSRCSKSSMAMVMEAKARHAAGCFIGESALIHQHLLLKLIVFVLALLPNDIHLIFIICLKIFLCWFIMIMEVYFAFWPHKQR